MACNKRSGILSISFSDYSEFYKDRLAKIDSDIRRKQITASLYYRSNSSDAVRKKAKNAIRSIERLEKQYNTIEANAIQDAWDRRRGKATF